MLITANEKILQNARSQLINILNHFEQQKDDAELAHERSQLEQLKQDVTNANKRILNISTALEKKLKLLANVQTQIGQVKANIAVKRAEMGTKLVDYLTQEEKDLLTRLNLEIGDLKEKLVACRANRVKAETRKAELETNLSTNLVRRKQELEAVKQSPEIDTLCAEAEAKRQELQDAKLSVEEVKKHLKIEVLESIQERNEKFKRINKHKSEVKPLEHQLCNFTDFAYVIGCYMYNKGGKMNGHKESIAGVYKMLHKCNKQLKQFSDVNKKALDYYANIADQWEELQRKYQEVDVAEVIIKELLSEHDQRKDESMQCTFKGKGQKTTRSCRLAKGTNTLTH
ncbi:hypothetical protein QVD17_41628 [Tagetes erecta]|uniref:Uncharacterized protein n=1 Tax=Tagetes erecta TaxID=13708 RepID=A0AAD8JMV1_TARER|nr:hypothetical protein QVD17_41628 [Tagetes erecta]